MLIVKIIENNTMHNVQELHLFLCLFSLAIFTSSTFSVHSSVSLSTNCLFRHVINNFLLDGHDHI